VSFPNAGEVAALLRSVPDSTSFTIEPLQGGGNNRAYLVAAENARYLLKHYFHHPDDPRDRLATEFTFSQFAWTAGLRCIPQPFAADPGAHLGLYEFVAGRRPTLADATSEAVRQAAEFFRALNAARRRPEAERLSAGSEACFSLDEHVHCTQRRVDRLLQQLSPRRPVENAAQDLVRHGLSPTWGRIRQDISAAMNRSRWLSSYVLDSRERCLSPSDFGLHNSILEDSGRFRFVDLEYAGWDDPAKTVCDFLCQPGIPIAVELREYVIAEMLQDWPERTTVEERIRLLLPVYQVKWCCILLNEFLPLGRARREFAGVDRISEDSLERQLSKVRHALAQVADSLQEVRHG